MSQWTHRQRENEIAEEMAKRSEECERQPKTTFGRMYKRAEDKVITLIDDRAAQVSKQLMGAVLRRLREKVEEISCERSMQTAGHETVVLLEQAINAVEDELENDLLIRAPMEAN